MSRFEAYDDDPVTVARALLGQRLVRVLDGERLSGRIVEVEAYLGVEDAAAHTFGGHRSPRNESMYLPGGHAYIYLVYGMHHCLNVVCGAADEGVAVLVRALSPEEGIPAMRRRRPPARRDEDLCAGPGRLAKAMGIDRRLDGVDLRSSEHLWIERAPSAAYDVAIEEGPRIGLGFLGAWARKPLRFALRDDPHVSRPFPGC